jgi:hypothetical protein
MGAERRQHERTLCCIPCSVEIYGKDVDGTVRNISAGGLSVQVNLPVAQGDVLNLTLKPDGLTRIDVQGIVWHDRRRKKTSGDAVQRIGLVLSNAPEAFRELLPTPKPKLEKSESMPPVAEEQKLPAKSPTPAARAEPPKPADCPKADRYRVRVKQVSSPRTRSIMVFAEDEDEARKFAREETGEDWQILEVDPV